MKGLNMDFYWMKFRCPRCKKEGNRSTSFAISNQLIKSYFHCPNCEIPLEVIYIFHKLPDKATLDLEVKSIQEYIQKIKAPLNTVSKFRARRQKTEDISEPEIYTDEDIVRELS
jgi:transcription elongation factor Elf1